METLVFLGILGIIGTIACDKLWPIFRHFLQPAVQLSDSENKRLKLSRADVIKALWAEIKYVKEDLRMIWTEEHGIRPKVKMFLGTMSGSHRQVLRPLDTTIELRFGIFAILNIVFVVLCIFIPFFLAEGLQGETIVQAIKDFQGAYYFTRQSAIVDEVVRARVTSDFKKCVTDRGVWNQTDYCVDLRNSLPPYKVEDMNLTDPIFADSPYRFLMEKGDANFGALRLSRNTSLQDVAFNTKPGGKKLLHELTCVPVSLGQFITQVNGSFELRVKDLIPESISHTVDRTSFVLHDSMILKTSNAVGSGHEIYRSKIHLGSTASHTEPVKNHSDQGSTWYQTDVDATLPWLEFKGTESVMQSRAWRASAMVGGSRSSRLQNFLITFKPGESLGSSKSLSDDPIFGAHRPWDTGRYVADREVSALGCAEVFRVCSADQCTEPPIGEIDGWLDLCYPGIMSVWLSTLIDPTYGHGPLNGRLRNFLSVWPNHRQRWQDDVEERFIRSMLRVRYASKYAAEQDLVDPDKYNLANPWIADPLLYRNSDHTNINVWGSVATAGGYLYVIAASHWLVLLLPLILPLKFLARAAGTGLVRFKDLIVFGRTWIHVAGSAIKRIAGAGNPLRRRRPVRSNTLPMDTWHAPQGNDEPDNPPRMARN